MCREFMDLENEVCADSSSSLVFVPYKEKFTPGSLHTCSKFSGKVIQCSTNNSNIETLYASYQVASHNEKEEFDQITRFLTRCKHIL